MAAISSRVVVPGSCNRVELIALDVEVTPASLTFGTEADPVPVNTPIPRELKLTNRQASDVCVLVEHVTNSQTSFKYSLEMNKQEPFVVNAGAEETVTVSLSMVCTTTLVVKLKVKTWHVGESVLKEAKMQLSAESEQSSSLDPDKLVRDKEEDGNDKVIGRGASGIVYCGEYQGRDVAIKVLTNILTNRDKEEFEREVVMLERCRHPAIVEFVGAVLIPGKQTIVTEFCPLGSLEDAMKTHPDKFDEKMKIKCLLDVSVGMEFLHRNDITHRDLKPGNLLMVSWNYRDAVVVKLADFGLTRAAGHGKTIVSTGVGTGAYMAPEILAGSRTYDKSVDVYSFSMLIYRIFSGRTSLEDPAFANVREPLRQIMSGKRPSIPPSCPEEIKNMMVECWNNTPSRRPSFSRINTSLKDFWDDTMFGKEIATVRRNASELLEKNPLLDSEREVVWTWGAGFDLKQLCSLLKANAIPVRKIEFRSLSTNIIQETVRRT